MAGRLETIEVLTQEQRAWIEEFQEGLRRMLGPRLRDLRLFGSTVRGEVHEESDLDLLVLVERLTHETAIAIADLASSISPWLSPLISDFDDYHAPRSRATGLYGEMRAHSVRL